MVIGEFCDTYPPQIDGVGRVTQAYCKGLAAMGQEVYYIGPENHHYPAPKGISFIPYTSIRVPGELFRAGVPALDPWYQWTMNQISFDIVHAHDPFVAGSEALRLARKLDIPLVSTFHSKYWDDLRAKTHSSAIADVGVNLIVRFYEKCDAVWTVNYTTAKVLREYGYHGNILVMENGTDPEPLDRAALERMRERIGLKPRTPMLLFVGQHNYKKNLHGVLGACALLRKADVPFELVTAGDGPDFDDIRDEARSLSIDSRCHFLGFMSDRAELMALYYMADLLVFPSIYDNAPMVLREAATMGTPGLVVKNSCSAEGVFDGVNGFVSPDESAESIAATIRRALPRAADAGAKAQTTIPVHWDIILRRVVREYERLIREYQSRRP